ncbi:MAG: tetratricopeptide repeat protein [Gemmatimonadaceae bacterium]
MQLDSTLAPAHVALGIAYENNYEWERSEAEFQTALRIDDEDVEAHVQYGRFFLNTGKRGAALEQFRLARQRDPASPLVLSWLSWGFAVIGEQDSALIFNRQSRQGGTLNYSAIANGATVLFESGLRDSSLLLVRSLTKEPPFAFFLEAALGDSARALAELQALEARTPTPPLVNASRAHYMLGVGDTAQALTALERATDAREVWPVFSLLSTPMFDAIRHSPRFTAVLQRVGLPPEAQEADAWRRPR